MVYSSSSTYQDAFVYALSDTITNILSFIPIILAAFLVLIIGLIIANWAKNLTLKILKALQFSALVKKSGFEPFLEKAEITGKIEEITAGLVKWLIILVFFIATVNLLGLNTVSVVLNSILNYIPRIVSAVLVITIGVLLAGLVEGLVKGGLSQIDIKIARFLAKIASYLVVVFASLAAINELKIAQALVNSMFIGFIAMLALGFGLAIGLGAKDLVSRVLEEWYENFRKQIKK